MAWDEKKQGEQLFRLEVRGDRFVYGRQIMFGSKDLITIEEILDPLEMKRDVELQDGTVKEMSVIMERWGEHTFFYARAEDLYG